MRTFSILSAAIALTTASVASAAVYQITDLGTLGGNPGSHPSSIGPTGMVAGTAYSSPTNLSALTYLKTGPVTVLRSPFAPLSAGQASFGTGIGGVTGDVVVGFSGTASRVIHATQNGADIHAAVATGPFAGATTSRAMGINAGGAVVGAAGAQAFYLPSGGPAQAVGQLGGTTSGVATSVSNDGVVVGFDYTGTWNYQFGASLVNGAAGPKAFMWTGGSPVGLGALGTGTDSYATSVETVSGVTTIVGQATTAAGDPIATKGHAFTYANGVMTALAELPFANYSVADDVNADGDVVGTVKMDPHGQTPSKTSAFLYHNGVMTDLNDVLPGGSRWVLQEATSINDDGIIVGYGTLNGSSTAFLLLPTGAAIIAPEPASVSMLGLGVVTLLAKRRRD